MVLLRRVIGDALRARRQAQHRTLREVSTAANVSLGYLSEIERGQKEASSELLGSICDALGAQLSEVLREVSDTVALAEQMDSVLAPVPAMRESAMREAAPREAEAPAAEPVPAAEPARVPEHAAAGRAAQTAALAHRASHATIEPTITDGQVSVTVRRDSPLKTTLWAKRTLPPQPDDRAPERDAVCAA